jgi:hypothetical protein
MENIMETIRITRKGKMKDPLERFYIFRETNFNNQINNKLIVKTNTIFGTIVHKDPYRGRTTPLHSGNLQITQLWKVVHFNHTQDYSSTEDWSPFYTNKAVLF